jgi:hypothetical protein
MLQFVPRAPGIRARDLFASLNPVLQGVALSIVLLITGVVVTGQGVAPFIYYRF